jgi:hypothetical protein
MAKSRLKFNKLKATFLFLGFGAILAIGSYGWHVYTLFRDWRLNMPQPQVEKLTRDLLLFHSRAKRFPKTFNEINDLIWLANPKPDYGADGKQARTKNYYYFYTKVNDSQCAIWAIPLGPQRHYASTFFFVITPEWQRLWRGKSLDESAISKLPAIPSPAGLADLQLSEIPIKSEVKHTSAH